MEDSNTKNTRQTYSISPDAVANRMGDQIVVVHVGTDRIFELNPTAARIWDLLSEGHDPIEIQRIVSQEFDVPAALASREIEDLLNSLVAENIISLQTHDRPD